MNELRERLLDLLYEENVRCDCGIEYLVCYIEDLVDNYIVEDWSVDDYK